jgi:DNA-binding transcriptional MerR regulator
MKYPKFKIGRVADLFGITAEAIRHYERKEIISPSEKANNYRYYDMGVTGEIAGARLYLSYGYTLNEANEILHNTDLYEVYDELENKAHEIEAEIRQKQMTLRSLRKMQSNIYHVSRPQEIRLETKPAFYTANIYEDGDIIENPDTYELCAEVLKYQPFGIPFIRFTYEELIRGIDYVPHCGVAIRCEDWHAFEGGSAEKFDVSPECLAVHTIVKMEPFHGPVMDCLKDVFAYMEQNHLTMSGDVMATTAVSNYQGDAFTYFRDVWIPVKNNFVL